ncbi:MAG: DUF4890 domain-containing protein [Prevotella sp.]
MKRIALMLCAMLAFGTMAKAQETERQARGARLDKTEMIKKSTERMVQRYGLNEEQAKSLLELNTEFAGKIGRGFGSMPRARRDSTAQGQANAERKPISKDMADRMEKMQASKEEYETKLKAIMTEEQYAKYLDDAANMAKNMKRVNGKRPQKGNQDDK